MYFAVVDGGTTNTSVYIIDQNLSIVAKGVRKVGVRDTAINDSSDVLRRGLQSMLEETTGSVGISTNELGFAVAFGMITSELGLMEIPHMPAPVGINELVANVVCIRDPGVFPADIPVVFVRGIKNDHPTHSGLRGLRQLDFLRGEETQVMGLIDQYDDLSFPLTVVILSSHTKYVSIDSKRRIAGSLTTLSGQLYEAVMTSTSIGKSMADPSGDPPNGCFAPSVIDMACECVNEAGFLRSLLMPRFMDVLLHTSPNERCLFMDSVIVSEDLKVLNEFEELGFPCDTEFVLLGQENRCAVFEYLLRRQHGVDRIRKVSSVQERDLVSVAGAIRVARDAGYLK
jgi:2-dehydro-3-deoxygalactonokinase